MRNLTLDQFLRSLPTDLPPTGHALAIIAHVHRIGVGRHSAPTEFWGPKRDGTDNRGIALLHEVGKHPDERVKEAIAFATSRNRAFERVWCLAYVSHRNPAPSEEVIRAVLDAYPGAHIAAAACPHRTHDLGTPALRDWLARGVIRDLVRVDCGATGDLGRVASALIHPVSEPRTNAVLPCRDTAAPCAP